MFLGIIVVLSGCRLSGTWEAMDYDSRTGPIPIDVVTFEANQFAATSDEGSRQKTTVGVFQQTAFRLILSPTDGPKQIYRLERPLGGHIRLSLAEGTARKKVTFKRVKQVHQTGPQTR